jgi:hypothetical protein
MTAMIEDFEKLKEIDGEAGERVIESLKDISSDFAGYIIEFPFGDIYSFHSYSMIRLNYLYKIRKTMRSKMKEMMLAHNNQIIS